MSALWILEALVVLVAARQFARIAARPAFRAETVWKPGWKWPLVGSAAILGAVGLWAALRWPLFRHIGAASLALFMVAAWWRARPSYGRVRRLPPGSLGLGHSLDALQNQRYYLEQAARFGPVFKSSWFGGPVVCVVGLGRARAILAAHGAALAAPKRTRLYLRFIPRGVLRWMEPETHREFAPRFRAGYGSLDLELAEPTLGAIYRANLARLAADSAAVAGGIPVYPYLRRAMLESVGYLFYGLIPGDPLLDRLERCLPLLQGPVVGSRGWRRTTREGMDGITAIIGSVRSRWPGENGGFTPALRAMADAHAGAVDDPTIAGNFILVSHIAHGDLTGLHMWIFKMVSDHPAVLAPVRAGVPDAGTRIVMETLRLEQSEFLYRRVTRGFEYEGLTIPAGWMIRFCIRESHRDPLVFPDPDRFNPDRFASRTYSREEYAPFGADAHACMGSHFAHFLGRLFVEELARGFDWQVVTDGPPELGGNRPGDHWRPSTRQRVVMTPRG
jgi:cytochrome P450